MKKIWILVILLVSSMTACSSTSSDKGSCSEDGEVCIKVTAVDPVIYGNPINIRISVTSEEDISSLAVSVFTYPITIKINDPENWENETFNKYIWTGGAGWESSIKKGQALTFNRQFFLPSDYGEMQIIVHASTPNLRAVDSLYIYQTKDEVQIYRPGTKVPITSGPLPTTDSILLKTLPAMPTATPYPKITPVPPVYLEATSTSPAYLPPISPTPGKPYP
jgi:hypothetical protein